MPSWDSWLKQPSVLRGACGMLWLVTVKLDFCYFSSIKSPRQSPCNKLCFPRADICLFAKKIEPQNSTQNKSKNNKLKYLMTQSQHHSLIFLDKISSNKYIQTYTV